MDATQAVVLSAFTTTQIAYHVLDAIAPVSRAFAPVVAILTVELTAVVLKSVPLVVVTKSAATVSAVLLVTLITRFR